MPAAKDPLAVKKAASKKPRFRERAELLDFLLEVANATAETIDLDQLLGNVAFRPPVPAYKHSAAIFLNLLGRIPTAKTHPGSPERPPCEREIMTSCAQRLGLI